MPLFFRYYFSSSVVFLALPFVCDHCYSFFIILFIAFPYLSPRLPSFQPLILLFYLPFLAFSYPCSSRNFFSCTLFIPCLSVLLIFYLRSSVSPSFHFLSYLYFSSFLHCHFYPSSSVPFVFFLCCHCFSSASLLVTSPFRFPPFLRPTSLLRFLPFPSTLQVKQ